MTNIYDNSKHIFMLKVLRLLLSLLHYSFLKANAQNQLCIYKKIKKIKQIIDLKKNKMFRSAPSTVVSHCEGFCFGAGSD